MLALVAHSVTDRDVSRLLEKVSTWGGQKLSMIIDTLADPLPVIGKLTMDVKPGTVTVTSTSVVVGCQGPLLCGQRTVEEFGRPACLFWTPKVLRV
ncbi:hypothetical protein MTO96_046142 [Rhipicephalus appendiculatus]